MIVILADTESHDVLRHFLNPPNWFTSASIACSSYAMMLMANGPPRPDEIAMACWLVALGGVFDMLDGRVARALERFSEFGVQLDSIADIVGFGVAPAIILYTWKLHLLGPLGVAVCFWFVLAAAFRLARFNVGVAEGSWPLPGHSEGLTSTMAGGLLVTFAWLANDYAAGRLDPAPELVAGLAALFGLGMVSSVPCISFKDLGTNRYAQALLGASVIASAIGAIVVHPSLFFGIGGTIYLVVGSVDALVTTIRHREALRQYHERVKVEAKARLAKAKAARAAKKSAKR